MSQTNFVPPPGLHLLADTAIHVLAIDSINAKWWKLREALNTQFGVDNYLYTTAWELRPGYGHVENIIRGFPNDWQGIYKQNVIVDQGAAVGQGLSREQRCMIDCWVRDGGALILLGGYWTFGAGGGWQGTVFDQMSPVASPQSSDLWDWESEFFPLGGPQPTDNNSKLQGRTPLPYAPASPQGVPLDPAIDGPLTDGLSWSLKPAVMVGSKVTAVKPSAQVLVTADGQPIVVTWKYGKGKVIAILAQPLGVAPDGKVAFWDWPDWPNFFGRLIKWSSVP